MRMQMLGYLYKTYGQNIYISIMSQYTPIGTPKYAALAERISEEAYASILDFAEAIGIENAFVQAGEAAQESFIPEFDDTGV